MYQFWQNLNTDAEVTLTADSVTAPWRDAAHQLLVTPLVDRKVIRVSGPDAQTFLQGQLSCDLKEVMHDGSRLGAHCNIKGHMVSLFRVMQQTPDSFWLTLHGTLLDSALAQLKKYIIFSKAQAEAAPELNGVAVYGADAAGQLADLLQLTVDKLPQAANHTLIHDTLILVHISPDHYELWGPSEALQPRLKPLCERAQLADSQQWLFSQIQAGLPDLRPATREAFIPQMVNLQACGGVSFTKGCYTGQEIVTRLQHRGQLKRPMYRARVCSPQLPEPGTPLHTSERENIGQVVLAAPCDIDGCFELLAVIVKERAEQEKIRLPDGAALTLLELPYTLDPRLFESKR